MSLTNNNPILRTHDYVWFIISLNGRHYLRTDEQTMGVDHPDNICEKLAEKFPAAEGYRISVNIRKNEYVSYALEN